MGSINPPVHPNLDGQAAIAATVEADLTSACLPFVRSNPRRSVKLVPVDAVDTSRAATQPNETKLTKPITHASGTSLAINTSGMTTSIVGSRISALPECFGRNRPLLVDRLQRFASGLDSASIR